jgi:hypothetical protein
LGTLLGTHDAFFDRFVQKSEGKRDKATVSLTVAFFNKSSRPMHECERAAFVVRAVLAGHA